MALVGVELKTLVSEPDALILSSTEIVRGLLHIQLKRSEIQNSTTNRCLRKIKKTVT